MTKLHNPQPATWLEARALVARENPNLKGLALNAETNRRFPNLKASDVLGPGYTQFFSVR
jgi:hypothetical protein